MLWHRCEGQVACARRPAGGSGARAAALAAATSGRTAVVCSTFGRRARGTAQQALQGNVHIAECQGHDARA